MRYNKSKLKGVVQMQKSKTPRCKNMMYEQQLDHLPFSLDEMKKRIENLGAKRYAYIIHDKDNGEKPHLHAMLSFENARSINAVAKQLGDNPQQLEKWTNKSANNGFAYLIHATNEARAKGKHLYSENEVTANFDYPALMRKIESDIVKAHKTNNVSVLLDALKDGNITREELEERLSGSELGRYKSQIDNVEAICLRKNADDWRKQALAEGKTVKVLWLFGKAGTGKSSLAKHYAQKQEQSFYVSGSSKDLFQAYRGEHTVILDDVRGGNITYEDLLHITNPYSLDEGVYAPSRYRDKPLACDLIIITAPYDPYTFYLKSVSDGIEGFDQLNRRLSLVVYMDMDYVYLSRYDDTKHKFNPENSTQKHNKWSKKNRPTPSSNIDVNVFNSMFN